MGKEYNRSTGYRPRKRKYHAKKALDNDVSVEMSTVGDVSASAKKLKLNCKESLTSNFKGYRIVDISLLFEELEKVLCCNLCHSAITITESKICGLSSSICISCDQCSDVSIFQTSRMISKKKNMREINLRSIYAMRCIGQGLSGLNTFCNVMDFPPPISQKAYDKAAKKIKCATAKVASASMTKAAAEEVKLTNSTDICISGDGTWKTRGHSSKIGVCTVIGVESGKVIDTEVLSSYCKGCKLETTSQHKCTKNHAGSAGKMEVVGMGRIFQRSELLRNVRYVKYIGDGDAKTFQEIQKIKPYDIDVVKEECVGHVQKRLGTRLRKLKMEMKGKKLSDGKPLSGKGRLTDKLIDKLTVYYGNAIRGNSGNLENMRKAVWAVYCHTSSDDEEPMHFFCPTGEASWCKYQQHIAKKEKKPFVHKTTIPKEVMSCVKKAFTDLSDPKLLKKCLGGKTQNPNESLNSLIWKYCPKTSGCGKIIVDVAVNEAVIAYNGGNMGRIDILKELEIIPGRNALDGALRADTKRIMSAEKHALLMTLEARRAKRMAEKHKNELLLQAEGVSYNSGAF